MNSNTQYDEALELQISEPTYHTLNNAHISRREFAQILGAGLLIAVAPVSTLAQQRGGGGRGRGGGGLKVAARIHIATNGSITLLTGKIEMGQGARAELCQAAAEELRVPVEQIQAIMGDTGLVPDDGLSAGSRTTPSTVPAVRQGAAAARNLLIELACQRWGVDHQQVKVVDGVILQANGKEKLTYADLAKTDELAKSFDQAIPANVALTPVKEWKVLGTPVPRPNRNDLVTGAHRYPSDITRPNMLYGKILRAPSYGAKLKGIDLEPAKAVEGVKVVQDGDLVGVAAPNTYKAQQALSAIAKTATWDSAPHPSSKEVYGYLKEHVRSSSELANPFADELGKSSKVLKQTYNIAYIQHTPMETRSALAEWQDGKLTVWTSTQNPFGYHSELARAFGLANNQVRVIVPDFGDGFGGKHTGEAAIEAARLAKAAGRPVMLKWTREEEFTWAYFRPGAVIEIEAGLDDKGALAVWHFVNINAGGSAVDTPYRIPKSRCRAVGSATPLRQGSYRALASTGNNFARESIMDDLAVAAGVDPLDFRLAHLENARLRAVLEKAAEKFNWKGRKKSSDTGIGLACGTEKGSVVAACVEVAVDRQQGKITVLHVCEAFECGAILNPNNLLAQVQGCIIMGLGGALREEMLFENGRMLNATFRKYLVPRFKDVPPLDIHLLNRPDLEPVGAGETPMIAIAPAIANAVFQATGLRIRQMPMQIPT